MLHFFGEKGKHKKNSQLPRNLAHLAREYDMATAQIRCQKLTVDTLFIKNPFRFKSFFFLSKGLRIAGISGTQYTVLLGFSDELQTTYRIKAVKAALKEYHKDQLNIMGFKTHSFRASFLQDRTDEFGARGMSMKRATYRLHYF